MLFWYNKILCKFACWLVCYNKHVTIVFLSFRWHLPFASLLLLILVVHLRVTQIIWYWIFNVDGFLIPGYHTLYQWYQFVESEHFPDPTGLRARIEQWTFGLYPACIKYLMSAFDVPEVWQAVNGCCFALILLSVVRFYITKIHYSGNGCHTEQHL